MPELPPRKIENVISKPSPFAFHGRRKLKKEFLKTFSKSFNQLEMEKLFSLFILNYCNKRNKFNSIEKYNYFCGVSLDVVILGEVCAIVAYLW
jgi:hypothetical protein